MFTQMVFPRWRDIYFYSWPFLLNHFLNIEEQIVEVLCNQEDAAIFHHRRAHFCSNLQFHFDRVWRAEDEIDPSTNVHHFHWIKPRITISICLISYSKGGPQSLCFRESWSVWWWLMLSLSMWLEGISN